MLSRIEMDYDVLYRTLKAEASLCLHQLVKSSKDADADHLFPFNTATTNTRQQSRSCGSLSSSFTHTYVKFRRHLTELLLPVETVN